MDEEKLKKLLIDELEDDDVEEPEEEIVTEEYIEEEIIEETTTESYDQNATEKQTDVQEENTQNNNKNRESDNQEEKNNTKNNENQEQPDSKKESDNKNEQNQNKNDSKKENDPQNKDNKKSEPNSKNQPNKNNQKSQNNGPNRPKRPNQNPRKNNAGAGTKAPGGKNNKLNSMVNAARNRIQNNKNKQTENNQNNSEQKKPGQNVKNKAQDLAKSGIKKIIKKNPIILFYLVIAGIILLILLLLLMLILGAGGEQNDIDEGYYLDSTYNFTMLEVRLNNGYFEETIELEDYIKGVAYAKFYEHYINNGNKKLKTEGLKAYMVTIKHDIFTVGQYNYENLDDELNMGNNYGYCNISEGCLTFTNSSGQKTYVTKLQNDTNIYPSDAVEIPPADVNFFDKLEEAYSETKYEILAPKNFAQVLENYEQLIYVDENGVKDNTTKYLDSYSENWITGDPTTIFGITKRYDKLIAKEPELENYYIYDLRNYAVYKMNSEPKYFWPVETDNNGNVETKEIISTFNLGTGNQGIVITKQDKTNGIGIVTAAEGYVSYCSEMDGFGEVGRYRLVMENTVNGVTTGLSTEYLNLASCPNITDVTGEPKLFKQGESLGTTALTYDFEFRVSIDTFYVNPLDYVDPEDPRPTSLINITFVEGETNKQTVCKTLKASGFSDNATAALMANIYKESSFRPDAEGDKENGVYTSYGLCQWHYGRKTRLKDYCDSDYTSIGCQLDYLVHELQNSYVKVYKSLMSSDSAYTMAYNFCYNFEVPADRANKSVERGNLARDTMLPYVQNDCG